MTTIIEVFVYPQIWPTHIQWVAMLLVLLARAPGKLSIDWLIRRRMLGVGWGARRIREKSYTKVFRAAA